MKTISLNTLRDLLAGVKGTTAVSMVTVTDARLKKANPFAPLGSVYKVCRVSAMVGTDHEAAVNRAQWKQGVEPGYQAGSRSWGDRTSSALVESKGQFYLCAQLNPAIKTRPVYVAPVLKGTRVRLMPVSKEVIAPFLPPDRREQEAERQGVTDPVIRRDYKLSSITQISILGQRYRIRA